MSWAANLLIFLAALPFSIWWLATFCSLIDNDTRAGSIIRLTLGICLVLILSLLAGGAIVVPVCSALATVTALHVLGHWLVAHVAIGAQNYDALSEKFDKVDVSH